MKDTDGLNDILGYARLVEGNQHSEHLSKVYLESVKTSNKDIEAIDKKSNNKNKKFQGSSKQQQNSKYRSQSRDKKGCYNCGSKHPPKHCPAFGKECYHCKKKNHFSNMCRSKQHSQSSNGHRPQSQNPRLSHKDHHELESQSVINMVTANGTLMNKSLSKYNSLPNTCTILNKQMCLMKLIVVKICPGC